MVVTGLPDVLKLIAGVEGVMVKVLPDTSGGVVLDRAKMLIGALKVLI